jgi:hypothetical protein
MTRRLPILIITILTLISCGGNKSKTKEISEPEKITDKFFDAYKQSGPRKALNTLLPTNKYISEQDADSVAIKLERLIVDLGDFQGHEKIKESTYGKGITHLTYIVKYSRQPLRFNFKFYQPGNGWRIQNFSYEVDFLDELDETTRAVRLRENYEE